MSSHLEGPLYYVAMYNLRHELHVDHLLPASTTWSLVEAFHDVPAVFSGITSIVIEPAQAASKGERDTANALVALKYERATAKSPRPSPGPGAVG